MNDKIALAMAAVDKLVGEHFPELLHATHAALAVVAVGCFRDNIQPTTLVFVGAPSSGKSTILGWLSPEGTTQGSAVTLSAEEEEDGVELVADDEHDPMAQYFYRSDKFTAASFVSQFGDAGKKAIGGLDLLPRIEKKTLLTPELGPLFSGKREELMDRLSTLVRVLDGQGLVTDAGTHGRRGYDRPINFQWLGCTTPVSNETVAVMANLGPRILYWHVDSPDPDDAALARQFDPLNNTSIVTQRCRGQLRGYALRLYMQFPRASVDTGRIVFPAELGELTSKWARVLCGLRGTVQKAKEQDAFNYDDDEGPRLELASPLEKAWRAAGILGRIARGSALAQGRAEVASYDLALIRHIALSSGILPRGAVFAALADLGGTAKTSDLATRVALSRETIRRYMKELIVVGLIDVVGKMRSGATFTVKLRADLMDLCNAPTLEGSK